MAIEARSSARYVGLGERRYRVDQGWLDWHPSSPKGFVSQLALDSRNRLFVLNRGNPVIQVFDEGGRFIDDWHSDLVTHGHGIFIDARDDVYVVDSDRHCVHVFHPDGAHRLTLGRPDHPRYGAPFNHPTDVAVAPNGDIFVSDGYGNSHVHKFSAAGEHLLSWGGSGKELGQFSNPHSLRVTRSSTLLVADRENHRVQQFGFDGAALGEFCALYNPTEISEDGDGIIYVTDQTPRLSAYAADGTLIGRCRTFGAIGHGIAVDTQGDIYIADMMPNTISRFRREH